MKNALYRLLRKSERYTKTDMVYLARSGWWINLGTVVISVFSLLLYIVFARTLTPEVYGTYQYLLSGGALLSALTLTGMNGAITRAVARGFDRTIYIAAKAQLRWSIIPVGIAALIATYYFLKGDLVLAVGFLIMGVLTPIIGTCSSYSSFLQGKQDFKRSFSYGMFWNISYYVSLLLVAFFLPSVLWLVLVTFGVQAITLAFVFVRTLRTYKPAQEADENSIQYGKHLSVMNFGTAIANQIDTVITFHLLGPAAVAIYSFATAIPERLAGFFKFLPAAALPKFSSKTKEQIWFTFGPKIILAILGMLFVALVYAFFAPLLFSLFFPAYASSVPYSQVYALVLITSISGLFTSALVAQQEVKGLYAHTVVTPILQILFQFFGAFFYGLWGLLIARLISQCLGALFAFIILRRVTLS